MAHGILTPAAMRNITEQTHKADTMHMHIVIETDAVRALIDDIIALRAHVLHLLPVNWDEVAEARDAIAHVRLTCGRQVADELLLASGLVCADPEASAPGTSEGAAP